MAKTYKSLPIILSAVLVSLCLYQIVPSSAYSLTTRHTNNVQNGTMLTSDEENTSIDTADNGTRSNSVAETDSNKELRVVFEEVISPVVCVLGIIGNVINLIVLTKPEMKNSSNCFLIVLAVSDMLFLAVQIPPVALNANKFKGMSPTYIIASRYIIIVRYVTSNLFLTTSSWLTVAITIERFIAIRFALKARFICTIHRAKVTITAIFITSFLFHLSKCFDYMPNLDHTAPKPTFIQAISKNQIYDSLMHIVNIAVVVFIPEVSLSILNTLLIYSLLQHNRSMRNIKDKGKQDLLQLTVIVISMVSIFIICNSIGLYLAISIVIYSRRQVLRTPTGTRLRIINNFLVLVNSSVNLILYTAISKRFRESFNNIFCQCCRKFEKKPISSIKSNSKSSNTKSTSSGRVHQQETPA